MTIGPVDVVIGADLFYDSKRFLLACCIPL